ncbi:hypothetical protein [Brumimicrobium mesophilum]|uniref:hypothetical protein n=1 Tax=Brumimicrobium mesophilum TaxID=392717 RepID=UPI000D1448FC|nr:hypothetical protein [Brumimicrobium mesophilum]
MKHILLALGLFGIGFLMSCENESKMDSNEPVEQEITNEDDNQFTDEHSHGHSDIYLNNGEKWEVNEEMKPYVMKGEQLVNEYINSGNSDYIDLAEKVSIQNKQLISSCTMNGESHNELHKWLHPHLELTKELTITNTDDQANYLVGLLQESYGEYHKFFK